MLSAEVKSSKILPSKSQDPISRSLGEGLGEAVFVGQVGHCNESSLTPIAIFQESGP